MYVRHFLTGEGFSLACICGDEWEYGSPIILGDGSYHPRFARGRLQTGEGYDGLVITDYQPVSYQLRTVGCPHGANLNDGVGLKDYDGDLVLPSFSESDPTAGELFVYFMDDFKSLLVDCGVSWLQEDILRSADSMSYYISPEQYDKMLGLEAPDEVKQILKWWKASA